MDEKFSGFLTACLPSPRWAGLPPASTISWHASWQERDWGEVSFLTTKSVFFFPFPCPACPARGWDCEACRKAEDRVRVGSYKNFPIKVIRVFLRLVGKSAVNAALVSCYWYTDDTEKPQLPARQVERLVGKRQHYLGRWVFTLFGFSTWRNILPFCPI